MRINQSLGILAPQRVRRKRARVKLPPWYAEVPPETIDIALEPRINRYARGPIRFYKQGSTQRKIAERLALFRDTMGIVDPKLTHTPEEMIEGLKEVMEERARILGEFDLSDLELDSPEALPGEQTEAEHEDEVDREAELHELLEGSDEMRSSASPESKSADHEEARAGEADANKTDSGESQELFGQPTDWLLKRLAEQQ